MGLADRILWLAGFDAQLARRVGRARRALLLLGLCSATASVAIGASAGYAGWSIGGPVVASALAVTLGLGTLNLLRAAAAGGGIAPHLSSAQARLWRPSWLPAVIMTLLAVCLAQPVLVALHGRRLDPQIAHYRAEQMRAHARLERLDDAAVAASEAAASATSVARQAAYAAALATERFLVQRTLLVWRDAPGACRDSALFVLLCLSPLLAARWPFGRALRAYELERYRRTRRFVAAHAAHTERTLGALLSCWPGRPSTAPGPAARALGPAELWQRVQLDAPARGEP